MPPIELGPSRTELFRTFRMPAITAVLGLFFLILGIVSGTTGHNLAIILGAVILALTAMLVTMELRDLERSWVAWDGLGLTIGRRGKTPLTLPWDDVAAVRLHESVGGRRRTPGRDWLYLEVQPLDWRAFDRTSHIETFLDPFMTEDTVGVPASSGSAWREHLDQTLRAAGLPAYAGVVTTQEQDPRAVWRKPKSAQTGQRGLF